jgi:hypothetical protein
VICASGAPPLGEIRRSREETPILDPPRDSFRLTGSSRHRTNRARIPCGDPMVRYPPEDRKRFVTFWSTLITRQTREERLSNAAGDV